MSEIIPTLEDRVTMIITGTLIDTPQRIQMPIVRFTGYTINTSSIRASEMSRCDYDISKKELGRFFTITPENLLLKVIREHDLPYTINYSLRFANNQLYGFDIEITISEWNVSPYFNHNNFSYRIYTVINGTHGGNTSLAAGTAILYPISDTNIDTRWKVNYANKNGIFKFIPCIMQSTAASASNSYIGLAVEYLDDVPVSSRIRGYRMALNETWSRIPNSVISANYGEGFPYPNQETGIGIPSLDDSSDSVTYPDNGLTDDITGMLNSSGFITSYRMTLSHMQSLATKLWDSTTIGELKKIFQNPMDGIIEAHMLPFVLPYNSDSKEFKIAGYSLGFNAQDIKAQQVEIDCGEVSLDEYWGTFLDYTNTTIKVFIPFVGIRTINPQLIQNGSLEIRYKVDITSGAFVCWLRFKKDGTDNILDRYTGNMALSLPVTSEVHANVANALVGTTAGIAKVFTARPIEGITDIATSAINANLPSYDTESQFSMNAGFMDNRTPYLIIERSITQTPNNYDTIEGVPSFIEAKLGDCSGYTEILKIIFKNVIATDEEKDELEKVLMDGVVF